MALLGSRPLKMAVAALAVSLALGACGRRGPLEAPLGGREIPGEDNAQRDPQASAGAIANPIGQPQRKNEPIKPPPGPFALDFLL